MNTARKDTQYSQFRGWMGEFQLDDDDEIIGRRWTAIESLASGIEIGDLETLIRLALKTRQVPTALDVQKITEYFEGDSFVDASKNSRELQVLSAATLTRIINSQDNDVAPHAALSLVTSLAGGARKPNLPFDLLAFATAAIGNLSRGVGRRPPPPELKKISLTDSDTDVETAIQQLADQLSAVTQVTTTILRQQDEELQMLWWLIGGRSEDLDIPFTGISGDNQAFVLAKELAAHTTILPGPSSVSALLAKAGLKSRGKIEVAAAINACEASWLAPLVNDVRISPVIHPIHFGIHRKLEVDQGVDWVPNWAGVTGLKADLAFSPLLLGEQFYRERLLLQVA